MNLSRLSAFLTMVSGINIFYGMYGVTKLDLINSIIPILNFFILLYAATNIETEIEKKRMSTPRDDASDYETLLT
jgi:uncharacterized membrane protein